MTAIPPEVIPNARNRENSEEEEAPSSISENPTTISQLADKTPLGHHDHAEMLAQKQSLVESCRGLRPTVVGWEWPGVRQSIIGITQHPTTRKTPRWTGNCSAEPRLRSHLSTKGYSLLGSSPEREPSGTTAMIYEQELEGNTPFGRALPGYTARQGQIQMLLLNKLLEWNT